MRGKSTKAQKNQWCRTSFLKTPSLEHALKLNFCPLLSWVCPELLMDREAQIPKQKLASESVRREEQKKEDKCPSQQRTLKRDFEEMSHGCFLAMQTNNMLKPSWRLLLSEGHLTLSVCTCSHHIPPTVLLQNWIWGGAESWKKKQLKPGNCTVPMNSFSKATKANVYFCK